MKLGAATHAPILTALALVSGCAGDRHAVAVPPMPSASSAPDAGRAERRIATGRFVTTLDVHPGETDVDLTPREPMPESAYVLSREPLRLQGFTLQAPCVDARLHAARDWATDPAQARSPAYMCGEGVSLDLDGDGTADVVFSCGGSRMQAVYDLYVRRGECRYFVGTIESSELPRALPTRSKGLRDLHTASDECPLAFPEEPMTHGYCHTIWRFDGKAYVRFRETPTKVRPAGMMP